MSHGSHLKHMLYGAATISAVLVVAGVPVVTALTYGLFLACPLMMLRMMISTNGQGHEHGSGGPDRYDGHDPVRREDGHRAEASGRNSARAPLSRR